jgi:hypothetical protein
MEPEGSLLLSKGPATYPNPEPDAVHAVPNDLRYILILSPHVRLWTDWSLFPQAAPPKVTWVTVVAEEKLYTCSVRKYEGEKNQWGVIGVDGQ